MCVCDRLHHINGIMDIADVPIHVVQAEFHPLCFPLVKPIAELCKQKGILLEGYSPLGMCVYFAFMCTFCVVYLCTAGLL